jgi:acyl-CoA reductase-like NAD-dependent aldehyde dehydrogenase
MQIISDNQISGVSPLDGRALEPVPVTPTDQIAEVVARARAAQTAWAALPVKERAHIVYRAGLHLMSHADEISSVLHRELGKPVVETYAVDLASAPEVFKYFARHSARFLQSEKVRFNPVMFPKKSGRLDRVPHGVVALITPWNYPVSIPLHNLVPALIAGNAVIMKPSEYAARTGTLLHRLLAEKLPENLFGLVQGDKVAGEALIRAKVDHVVFIGGLAGGRAVAHTAADNVTPVALELGGKDAAIVLEDADLERAAHGIAWAGYVNAGQSCAGVERVYVVEPVAKEFTDKLTAIVGNLRVGDDKDKPGSVDIGAIGTPAQLATVRRHIGDALARGANSSAPNPPTEGHFVPPAVLTDVPADAPVLHEETFGPVVPVQVVPDEAAAIAAANSLAFGLTGSVWTRDLARGERVANQLRVGVATVNNHMFSGAAPSAPWQGSGLSGYGTQNGKLALYNLTRPRLLAVDANPAGELWWFPYDRALLDLARGLLLTRDRAGLLKNPVRWLGAYAMMLRGVALRMVRQRRK